MAINQELNLKDTDIIFISKCYNLSAIVDDVINSLSMDDSELYLS